MRQRRNGDTANIAFILEPFPHKTKQKRGLIRMFYVF